MTRRRSGALTRDEEQQAFHRAVPEWDRSVAAERVRLGYRPEWRPDRITEWDGTLPRPSYWEWRATAGLGLDAVAGAEVERLGLPVLSSGPAGGYVRYWLACFLSDYDLDHLERIQHWPLQLAGPVDLERVYPPERQTLRVTVTGIDGPTLTISGPVGLVSRDTLQDAVDRALRLVGNHPKHPVLSRRKARAGALVRARKDDRHALAFAMHADGKSSGKIADAIEARWPERIVDPSTVRRWLRDRSG